MFISNQFSKMPYDVKARVSVPSQIAWARVTPALIKTDFTITLSKLLRSCSSKLGETYKVKEYQAKWFSTLEYINIISLSHCQPLEKNGSELNWLLIMRKFELNLNFYNGFSYTVSYLKCDCSNTRLQQRKTLNCKIHCPGQIRPENGFGKCGKKKKHFLTGLH